MKRALKEAIEIQKVISIIRLNSSEGLTEVVQSLYDGGIRLAEVTLNTPGAYENLPILKEQFPDMYFGAGTVLNEDMAKLAIEAGAEYLITPTLQEDVIKFAVNRGIPVIPGVYTPTEIIKAYDLGVEHIKLFPVRNMDPKYLKDIQGPLPFVKSIPVGGVDESNAQSFFEAGAVALGIGGSLVQQSLVDKNDFDEIERRARTFVELAK